MSYTTHKSSKTYIKIIKKWLDFSYSKVTHQYASYLIHKVNIFLNQEWNEHNKTVFLKAIELLICK